MNRYRDRIGAIALIVMTPWGMADADEPARTERTPGFALPDFTSGYPNTQFEYEEADAKRLALELLPVAAKQVVRAIVREQVGLPGGGYHGLYIDLVLEPRVERQSICEQPRIAIVMRHNSMERFQARTMRLVIRDGSIAEHDFDTVHRTGRYRRLPETPQSPTAALEACRELTGDMSGWKAAMDASDFAGQQWRQQQLISALETLTSDKVKCIGVDDKPCKQSQSELLSYFRDTPARYSVGQFVPGEGEINIFDYDDDDVDRDVTMWLVQGRPRTISIRLRRANRPVI
ncbi:MAG: hypothetical protein JHD35_25945 [Sphingopyxis sp.]|nr:hypothetical protein [Sphingopyxis sp.]